MATPSNSMYVTFAMYVIASLCTCMAASHHLGCSTRLAAFLGKGILREALPGAERHGGSQVSHQGLDRDCGGWQ